MLTSSSDGGKLFAVTSSQEKQQNHFPVALLVIVQVFTCKFDDSES